MTENVSCSGVLLRGRRVLPPATPVELLLTVPRELAGTARMQVLCRGQIARVSHRILPLAASSIGVSVGDYELTDGRPNRAREGRLWRNDNGLAGLAHALNNMLAIIVGSSELILTDDNAAAAIKQHADNIRTAAEAAAELVAKLARADR